MTDDLQHIISSKRELLARGEAPRPAVNYTEGMPSDQKDRFIEYLIEQNESQKLDLRAMQAVLVDMKEDLSKSNESLNELTKLRSEISSLRSELQQERKERKSLERKNARLQEKIEFANKNRFGSKSQKSNKPKSATAESETQTSADRGKEEDNFDGTSGSIEKEVSVLPDGTKHVAKERDLSNRPNNYSTMGIRNGVM